MRRNVSKLNLISEIIIEKSLHEFLSILHIILFIFKLKLNITYFILPYRVKWVESKGYVAFDIKNALSIFKV